MLPVTPSDLISLAVVLLLVGLWLYCKGYVDGERAELRRKP
jgi:hypothetical protein